MTKPTVLLLGKIDHATREWEALSDVAELKICDSKNREEFIKDCAEGGKWDGVVAAYRTFVSVAITGLIDEELISKLPKSLKYICHNGAGYDQIDADACTKAGINVSNVPTAVDGATADTAFFLLLGALRKIQFGLNQLRRGEFKNKCPIGHDPAGKVLGILGMGGIGRAMAQRARGFDMEIIYHNRNRLAPELEAGAKYVSFDELLAQSDVLSLNLPLNKHTRHIISTKEFEKMKDGVVVVNTARGPVMNEDALVKALENGKVFSAGLDVYENEPEVHPGLLKNENVILVPHLGTHTYETQYTMECVVLDNVRAAIEKGELNTHIPEQKK